MEEYRKRDGRFDERLFNLEQEVNDRIFSESYKINQDQNFRELQKFYCNVMRYLFSLTKIDDIVRQMI